MLLRVVLKISFIRFRAYFCEQSVSEQRNNAGILRRAQTLHGMTGRTDTFDRKEAER